MPTFTGNLRTIGIEARNGLYPEITCTATNAGVNLISGNMFAGSRTFSPDANGNITLILAGTVGLVPETKVKLTGGWLGEDTFFDLPEFHVPEEDGTLADLIAFAGLSSQQYISWGLGPPAGNYPGSVYFDLSTYPPKFHLRGSI
jgi:hypothetical protein